MSRSCVVIVLGGLVSSCAKGPAPPSYSPVLGTQQVYYDDTGSISEFQRLAVKDDARWNDLWAQVTFGQPSPPPKPAVDFTREMLIVAAAGPMSPGDRIRVDSVGVEAEVFVVVVSTIRECQDFPANVYPVAIVKVARSERPVTFRERREDC